MALHKEPSSIPQGSTISVRTKPHNPDLEHRYTLQLNHYLLDLGLNFNRPSLGAEHFVLDISEQQWSITPLTTETSL